MKRDKKFIIILSVVLGLLIAAVALFVFWDKTPNEPEPIVEESSLFDIDIYVMDRGYIDDEDLIQRIREECSPYATHLNADTTFYTEDGNDLYASLFVNSGAELRIHVNLENDSIEYELLEYAIDAPPSEPID